MVTTLKVAQYQLKTEPLGRVTHKIAFCPSMLEAPIELKSLVAKQLVDFLNVRCEWDQFEYEIGDNLVGIKYRGKEALVVKVIPPFRLGIHLTSDHAHLSERIEQFLKTHYPIKVWKEVS